MRVPEDVDRRVPNPPEVRARDFLGGQGTYAAEIAARTRQERLDEEFARRLQFGMMLEDDDTAGPEHSETDQARSRPRGIDIWATGNAGTHHLNDDFVQNPPGLIEGGFDEATISAAAYGRRGERESGRRTRPNVARAGLDAGLAANAFGDASVLGITPYRFPGVR